MVRGPFCGRGRPLVFSRRGRVQFPDDGSAGGVRLALTTPKKEVAPNGPVNGGGEDAAASVATVIRGVWRNRKRRRSCCTLGLSLLV